MASVTRYSKEWKVCYRIFFPNGTDQMAFAHPSNERIKVEEGDDNIIASGSRSRGPRSPLGSGHR